MGDNRRSKGLRLVNDMDHRKFKDAPLEEGDFFRRVFYTLE